MFPKDFFIRNLDADSYRENFLVSSIVTVFIIRIFLRLTHYPQLGGGNLHIAHILWGGFFMLAAIIILFSFLSRKAISTASILGGIGFGAFIDELGKFITNDNDYFFRPTVAFIYIIFVLIYLILKFIPKFRKISEREYLVNAIETLKESAIEDFDFDEKKRALEYLEKSDQHNSLVKSLHTVLLSLKGDDEDSRNMFRHFELFVKNKYYSIAKSGLIVNGIIIFLSFQTLRTFYLSATFLARHPSLSISEWGQFYSSILAGFFVLIGVSMLKFSKHEAYRFFRIAILVTILLTDFFAFMKSQWYELFGLTANLFILAIINYAMFMEKAKNKQKI